MERLDHMGNEIIVPITMKNRVTLLSRGFPICKWRSVRLLCDPGLPSRVAAGVN